MKYRRTAEEDVNVMAEQKDNLEWNETHHNLCELYFLFSRGAARGGKALEERYGQKNFDVCQCFTLLSHLSTSSFGVGALGI
jgi:hypothetical protein